MTAPTLGTIAAQLEALKAQGVTLGSVEYAARRVWWEEVDERAKQAETIRKLAAGGAE